MYRRLKDEKYYRKVYFQDSFYNQCMDVDPLTMVQFDQSVEQVKKIINEPIFSTCTHMVGVGCGDSNVASFAVKDAFAHYLPDVEYEGVEAIEMSRHYDYPEDCSQMAALFISFSGGVIRTLEAMEQCKRHGVTTVGVTAAADSDTAKNADIFYYTDTPEGDNNAGLRTYYSNVMSCIVLAAAMAEKRTGKSYLPELREQVKKYHDAFFAEIANIDETCFRAAIHFMDKGLLEVTADGHNFWSGRFVQAKILELSGDVCSTIDSENYMHVNSHMCPGSDIAELVILNSNDGNVKNMANTVNAMVARGQREVLLFCDKTPEEVGITEKVIYCHVPVPEKQWNFLAPIYAYLPGSIFAGFRHTTLGEPMFRGGMDFSFFPATYCSPMEVVEL